uniref:RING-type domain-containing protein n=1 Tax=Compsopogon caeruleus TaxID=31354 RepID=A0A7S1TAS7_9RHOD|mmetsp:Transcript_14125/g.28908  ORF Transcript_14125/g.28908 Transcript_14125/m.28908 type:complete len:415 (+) Transcript_14125:399-1643(+)
MSERGSGSATVPLLAGEVRRSLNERQTGSGEYTGVDMIDDEEASWSGDDEPGDRHSRRWGIWVGRDRWSSRWTCTMDLWMLGRLWFLILATTFILSAISLVWWIALTDSTRGWAPTRCLVKKRIFDAQCMVPENDQCPEDELEVRLVFVVENPETIAAGLGEVNAYWGPGPETFTVNILLARSRLRQFETLKEYDCWYKPGDPARVSMARYARATGYRYQINHSMAVLAILVVLGLFSLTIRAAIHRQEEMEEADRQLELRIEKHQKTSVPRWLMKRLAASCRVLRSDIITDGSVDCAICLDELFVEFDPRRTLRMPCNHLFHEDCLGQWVVVGGGRTCPLCLFDLHQCPKIPVRGRTRVPEDQPSSARESSCSGALSPRSLQGIPSASEDDTDGGAFSDHQRSNRQLHRSPWR